MKYVGLKHKFPLGGDPKFDRRVEIEITFIEDQFKIIAICGIPSSKYSSPIG